MIWGPWSGVGMVSDLEAHLGRRGLAMIAPAVGASKLGNELERGAKGDVEVIVAGDLGSMTEGPDPDQASSTDSRREPASEPGTDDVAITLPAGGVVR
jgi:hypothetical protein